jgi:asparagine synthase (glutamine-hydrolysing)
LTILAGIFRRRNDVRISDQHCVDIERSLSRNTSDKPFTFRNSRVFLAKIDIGVYSQGASIIDSDGCVSLLTGEPLLLGESADACRTRDEDLKCLHSAWKSENWNLLEKARGVFCAVHFSSLTDRLTLISDKLCIRPLYYYLSDDYVIFVTALRILESLQTTKKVMDVRGIAEITTLGYPLSTRTPYHNVFYLKPAELIQFKEENVSYSQYFRWDKITISREPEIELAKEAYRRFSAAIKCRLRSDTGTVAFLSGGLDSRCIVGLLRNQEVEVYTFNFSDPITQDKVFAEQFANLAGTIHIHAPKPPIPDYSKLMADAWSPLTSRAERIVQRPGLIWSGDGGSVGLGHVYLTKAIIDLIRGNNPDAAITAFLEDQHASILKRLFQAHIVFALGDCLSRGIRKELDAVQCEDPARGFHLFLMQNDQRRHLSKHFENIDVHRIEFHLPFFDSYFLEWIMACPVDLCLNHHFYGIWLELFPIFLRSVPWQTYPGHEPCPLPGPNGLRYQWGKEVDSERVKDRKRSLVRRSAAILRSNEFPHDLIKKHWLFVATWMYRLGLKDYGYVIKTAETVFKYSKICNGNFKMPPKF